MISVPIEIVDGFVHELDLVGVFNLPFIESVISLLPAADCRVRVFHFVNVSLIVCLLYYVLVLRAHKHDRHFGDRLSLLELWWQEGSGQGQVFGLSLGCFLDLFLVILRYKFSINSILLVELWWSE